MHAGRFLAVFSAVLAVSCSSPLRRDPRDAIVPAPIAAKANAVLAAVGGECAARDGTWANEMSPGCAIIWAAQLGYGAGLRREREDLVEMGRRTVSAQRSRIDSMILKSIFGGSADERGAYGFPALLASASLGGSWWDYRRFRLVLDRAVDKAGTGGIGDVEGTGLAATLAETARLGPDDPERPRYLEAARSFAGRIRDGSLRAMALGFIARATREDGDIAALRGAVEAAAPAFAPDGSLAFAAEDPHILSYHLALTGAAADLAILTGDPRPRLLALAMLDSIFSDALFDGRHILHDRYGGERSSKFCSGCNLHALYLVDRLYGDTWAIGPLPPPSLDAAPPARGARSARGSQPEKGSKSRQKFEASVVEGMPAAFRSADGSCRFSFTYRLLPAEDGGPDGRIRIEFDLEHDTGLEKVVLSRKGEDALIVPLEENVSFNHNLTPLVRGTGAKAPGRWTIRGRGLKREVSGGKETVTGSFRFLAEINRD
jgi:hypothetical protein